MMPAAVEMVTFFSRANHQSRSWTSSGSLTVRPLPYHSADLRAPGRS